MAPVPDDPGDPRELEDWFVRLPPEVQDDVRRGWRERAEKFAPWLERRRAFRRRCLREGLLAVGVPVALAGFRPLAVLLSIPLGLATGWLWWLISTGRLTSGLLAMTAVLAALAAGGIGSGNPVVAFYFTCLAAFLAGLGGALLGLRRELDRREQAL